MQTRVDTLIVRCGWESAVMHVKYVVVKFANDNAVAGCSVLT